MNTPTIEITLFHIPTASELHKGLKVAYKGYDGEYAAHRTAAITDIFTQDNTTLYNLEGFAYTADELRLIKS